MSDNLRSVQELHIMRNQLRQSLQKLSSDSNPTLIENYQAKIVHLKKSIQMIEDHINFYDMVRWLNNEDVSIKKLTEAHQVI